MKSREVVFVMEDRKQKASVLDYSALCELALSRNIKYVEAKGLDTRKGVRFSKNGSDWIAVDSDLPITDRSLRDSPPISHFILPFQLLTV